MSPKKLETFKHHLGQVDAYILDLHLLQFSSCTVSRSNDVTGQQADLFFTAVDVRSGMTSKRAQEHKKRSVSFRLPPREEVMNERLDLEGEGAAKGRYLTVFSTIYE